MPGEGWTWQRAEQALRLCAHSEARAAPRAKTQASVVFDGSGEKGQEHGVLWGWEGGGVGLRQAMTAVCSPQTQATETPPGEEAAGVLPGSYVLTRWSRRGPGSLPGPLLPGDSPAGSLSPRHICPSWVAHGQALATFPDMHFYDAALTWGCACVSRDLEEREPQEGRSAQGPGQRAVRAACILGPPQPHLPSAPVPPGHSHRHLRNACCPQPSVFPLHAGTHPCLA